MASANPLSVVLTADEFLKLNDTVRVKLEECLRKYEQDSNQLRIQFSQLQTSSEQQCFELDTQLQQLREQQLQEEKLINELTEGKNWLDSEVASLNEQRRALESKVLLLESSSLEWKKEKNVLLLDKEDLSSLVARRNDNLDRLTSELKSLTDQLVDANKEKTEAMIKSEELSGKQLALDYKEKRLDQERELIIKQRSKLQEELDARTMEIMSIRREKTFKVLELQADLAEKIEELRLAQKTISEMTSTRDVNEKQIKELNDKLRDLSESDMKIAENHRNELRTQMRLTELYKESSDDFEAKSRELSKAVEELQRLLGDASVRFGDLESETKADIDHLKDQLATSAKKIADQKKELEQANGLIDANRSRVLTDDAIESMSPSAAAASRLLKYCVFSKYCDLTTDLQVKEAENKQLNDYLDNFLKEMEDRAPTIARQREDYEKTVEMVASLTRQLDLAVDEAESEKEKAREAQRMLTHAERSGLRFEKQVKDLSKQVSFLIREIEILRGNRMRDSAPPGEDQEASSSEGSAAAVIDRRLVTFRDVMELQQRNLELLAALREVTEKQDEEEKNAIASKTAGIQQVLENALAETEQHRETRRRHEQLMESVIQERDMYRTLVQEAGLNESRSPTKFRDVVTSTPAAGRHDTSAMRSYDIDKHSSELKEKLKEQETSHQALIKEMKDTEKTLKEQIQSLQATVSDVRAQNVRLATQAEYTEEKSKLLQP